MFFIFCFRNNYQDVMFPWEEEGASNILIYPDGEILFVPDGKLSARYVGKILTVLRVTHLYTKYFIFI